MNTMETAQEVLEKEFDEAWDSMRDVPIVIGSEIIAEDSDGNLFTGSVVGIEKVYEYMTPPSDVFIVQRTDGTEIGIHQDDPIMVRPAFSPAPKPFCCVCKKEFAMWEKIKSYNGFDHCVSCWEKIEGAGK